MHKKLRLNTCFSKRNRHTKRQTDRHVVTLLLGCTHDVLRRKEKEEEEEKELKEEKEQKEEKEEKKKSRKKKKERAPRGNSREQPNYTKPKNYTNCKLDRYIKIEGEKERKSKTVFHNELLKQ